MLDLCASNRGQTLALFVVDEVWNLAAPPMPWILNMPSLFFS